jgi:hypothetical protein
VKAAREVDPVDVALAQALADASTAGRFDVVARSLTPATRSTIFIPGV